MVRSGARGGLMCMFDVKTFSQRLRLTWGFPLEAIIKSSAYGFVVAANNGNTASSTTSAWQPLYHTCHCYCPCYKCEPCQPTETLDGLWRNII
ncbi:hypothetical protein C1H46_018968 [Malus baccata]|uniref:Uncharacterized protein n=1 Tax=Malus baccata TaxID=106549 RepID=A0A540M9H7_MALBA|nr:hypothetical protein C1H46_018968 [Malus baccata]